MTEKESKEVSALVFILLLCSFVGLAVHYQTYGIAAGIAVFTIIGGIGEVGASIERKLDELKQPK